MHWLEWLEHDVRCGRHSDIPPCCIAWFTTWWRLFIKYPSLRRAYWKVINHQGDFYHIPCPLCLALKRERYTLECSCSDEHNGFSIYDIEIWPRNGVPSQDGG